MSTTEPQQKQITTMDILKNSFTLLNEKTLVNNQYLISKSALEQISESLLNVAKAEDEQFRKLNEKIEELTQQIRVISATNKKTEKETPKITK